MGDEYDYIRVYDPLSGLFYMIPRYKLEAVCDEMKKQNDRYREIINSTITNKS